MSASESDVTGYTCEDCGRTFLTWQGLNGHTGGYNAHGQTCEGEPLYGGAGDE